MADPPSNNKENPLTPEQLAHLMNIGSDIMPENPPDSRAQKKDLFRELIQTELPADQVMFESLPIILRQIYRDIEALAKESIGVLLAKPDVSVYVLQQIKKYGRKLAENSRTEEEHDSAIAIYYCAIACALIYHDEKITSFSYAKLAESFMQLKDAEWIPRENAQILAQAYEICCRKIG